MEKGNGETKFVCLFNPTPVGGAQNGVKRGFYSIFVVSGTNFRIIKFVFLAFFEAKMTKIVILDQKLIVPNDYQLFWAHFEWFLSLFQNSDVKISALSYIRRRCLFN